MTNLLCFNLHLTPSVIDDLDVLVFKNLMISFMITYFNINVSIDIMGE